MITLESLVLSLEANRKHIKVEYLQCLAAHQANSELKQLIFIIVFIWLRSPSLLLQVREYLQLYPEYQNALNALTDESFSFCEKQHEGTNVFEPFTVIALRFGIGLNDQQSKYITKIMDTLAIVNYLTRFHQRQTCINLWRRGKINVWIFSEIMVSVPIKERTLIEIMHRCRHLEKYMTEEFFVELAQSWSKVDGLVLDFNISQIDIKKYESDFAQTLTGYVLSNDSNYFSKGVPDHMHVLQYHMKDLEYENIVPKYWAKKVHKKNNLLKHTAWIVMEILLRFGTHEAVEFFNSDIKDIFKEIIKASKLAGETKSVDVSAYVHRRNLTLRSIGLAVEEKYTNQIASMKLLLHAIANIKSRRQLQNIRITIGAKSNDYITVFELFYSQQHESFKNIMQLLGHVEDTIEMELLTKLIHLVKTGDETKVNSADVIYKSDIRASEILKNTFNIYPSPNNDTLLLDEDAYDFIKTIISTRFVRLYWHAYKGQVNGSVLNIKEETWLTMELLLNYDETPQIKSILYNLPNHANFIKSEIKTFHESRKTTIVSFYEYDTERTWLLKRYGVAVNTIVENELQVLDAIIVLTSHLKAQDLPIINKNLPLKLAKLFTIVLENPSFTKAHQVYALSDKPYSLCDVVNLLDIIKESTPPPINPVVTKIIRIYNDKVKKDKAFLKKYKIANDYKEKYLIFSTENPNDIDLNHNIDLNADLLHDYRAVLPRYWVQHVYQNNDYKAYYNTWLTMEILTYFKEYDIETIVKRLVPNHDIANTLKSLKNETEISDIELYHRAQHSALRSFNLFLDNEHAYGVDVMKEIFAIIPTFSKSEILQLRNVIHDHSVYPPILGLFLEIVAYYAAENDVYSTMRMLRPIECQLDVILLDSILNLFIYIKLADREKILPMKRIRAINKNIHEAVSTVFRLKDTTKLEYKVEDEDAITDTQETTTIIPSPTHQLYTFVGAPLVLWSLIATGVVIYNRNKKPRLGE